MGKDLHYCKTPMLGKDGQLWKCRCGRRFKYKAGNGSFRRGHWLQISG